MSQDYNINFIQHYFNNDSPENPRSDGGFITIAVQVNPIDVEDPKLEAKSEGYITIWHIKTTIPKGSEEDTKNPLPKVGSTPIFAGELKMKFENDPVDTDTQQTTGKKPPKAVTCVPSIGLEETYRGLRMAPIFWKFVCETAQANFYRKLNEWNIAKAKQQALSKEDKGKLTRWVSLQPPMSLVAAGLPNPTMGAYWDKVGFNFFASQHEQAWSLDEQCRADTMAVLTGKATAEVKARIAPWLQVTTSLGEIQGATDYLAELAADGMKRGGWSETKAPF